MRGLTVAAIAAVLIFPASAQTPVPSPGTGDIQADGWSTSQFKNRAPSKTWAGPLSAFGAVAPFGSPVPQASRTKREASIRYCNSESTKTYAVRDSNWSLFAYRACMAHDGQPE
jgi:hypothetical protein